MDTRAPMIISQIVESQHWLDPLGKALQQGVRKLFKSGGASARRVQDFLHGTWLGHPLHPVLTDVPVGAWTTALALDMLEVGTGRRSFGISADAAIGLGLTGAAGAAVTGLTDWQHLGGRPRRVGLLHALLNTGAMALYAMSWLMRRRGRRPAGRGYGLLGYALAMAGSYLGGHLVFSQRAGVNRAAETGKPEKFVPVLPVSELAEGRLRRVEAQGVPILLVRRGQTIYALAETCAHLGGPLSEGWLVNGSVVCPWHESRYALHDGRVLDGPSTYPQPCYETRVRNEQIEVRAAQRDRAGGD